MRLRTVICIALAFCLGVSSAERFSVSVVVIPMAAVFLLGLFSRRPILVAAALVFGGAFIHASSWARASIQPWVQVEGQETPFVGVVVAADGMKARLADLGPGRWPGQLEVTGAILQAGTTVTIRCRPSLIDPTWSRSMARRTLAECANPIVVEASTKPRTIRGWLARGQLTVIQAVTSTLRVDEGALAAGLLVGDSSAFSATLKTAFQATGTTHIVALSGFNVSIILSVLLETLAPWVGRRGSAFVGLGLLLVFIVMTGASASVVRAAVMAVVALSARFLGRPIQPLRPLLYTGLVMVWQNPALLLHDLGFQLSSASTAGLLLGSEPIARRLTAVPEWLSLRTNLATTIAATLASWPIILPTFQRLSVISFLVNVVVLPFVPLAMALSAVQAVVAMAAPALLSVVRPPTEFILTFIIHSITSAARVPGASVVLTAPAIVVVMAAAYFILVKTIFHDQKIV